MFSQSVDSIRRVLVIDDDTEIRVLIARKLTQAGFDVLSAASGTHALEGIERNGLPHLAIVDINMPGMSGLEFCEAIQRYYDLPVIMVTAVNEAATTIKTIEQYAEDYIVKPFNLDEMVARVQRVLRRIGDFSYADGPLVELGPHLSVNFSQQIALIKGTPVALTPTETKLLHILWRNAGRLVTNDFLLGRLWPGEEIYEDALRVHVHHLRHKIERTVGADKYILTGRDRGYRFLINDTKSK